MRSGLRVGLLALAAGAGSACGCADERSDWEPGRPRIDSLRFLQQRPQDPSALEFSILFTDTDATISAGILRMSINGLEVAALPVSEVFASQLPPIEPGATEGELEVIVRVGEQVEDGAQIEVGFVLDEGDGGECTRSNAPTVVLRATKAGQLGGV